MSHIQAYDYETYAGLMISRYVGYIGLPFVTLIY